MFQPKQMSKLLIIASKEQLDPVITELYDMNIFHIDDFVEKGDESWDGFKIGMPMKGADTISASLVKIRSIASAFGMGATPDNAGPAAQISQLKRRIETELPAIAEEVEKLISQRSKLETSVKELEQKIEAARPYAEAPFPLELLRGYESVSFVAGVVKGPVQISVPHEIWEKTQKNGNFIIVAVRSSDLSALEKELMEAQLQKVTIPEETGYAPSVIEAYEQKISALGKEIESLTSQMTAIREKHQYFLLSSEELLTADIEQAEAPLRFATTDLAFVVVGWVPSERVTKIYENLDRVTASRCYVSELEIEDYNDGPPVEFNNPEFTQPTQLFVDLMARPKYSEVDPSLLMAIVYPIMFGLILGDVGYGAILLAMSLGLRSLVKGNEQGMQLIKILRNCSISSIIFGVIFSEFFGFTLPWAPLWFSRHIPIGVPVEGAVHHASAIPQLLVVSIWIGILHITLGRLWGAQNAARMDHGHHRSLKIYANIGWILVMWGIIILIWSKFPIILMPDLSQMPVLAGGLNIATIGGAIMLILGLVFIARENVLDLMEVPTIISHVLSYTRLIAVGLSSVAIALVTNFIAIGLIINPQLENLTPVGIVLIVVGIVIFLFGHTLNTALGILGGGLHPLRLHYVEFFTKFYRGGGKKYSPFGMIRNLTEQNVRTKEI
ncbi:MAG TPA: V-type ATP synthase subunit I [Methanospirillum sp.]|nr:V-type ATP synthase subunit I [Methanospirillum sp.]